MIVISIQESMTSEFLMIIQHSRGIRENRRLSNNSPFGKLYQKIESARGKEVSRSGPAILRAPAGVYG
jgi:hypothetical protein